MSNSSKLLTAAFVATALLVTTIPAAAQDQSAGMKVDQAAIQRSYQLQARLASIEQNKAAFIDQIIGNWAAVVDPNVIDVSAALRPILEKATPLRLYAASLVGDWRGMIQVAKGRSSAVQVVNTLDQAQAPSASTATSAADPLGDATDQLVFTPIAPCRIADTRGVGARTGMVFPGAPRVFDLTTGGFAKGQGGSSSCPGLPSFNHFGWSVNFTTTGYSANGFLQVGPFPSLSAPATSIVDYGPAVFALANASTTTGCYGCTDSIVVFAGNASTHVILDVYGYFERAVGFAQTDKLVMAGTTTTLNPGDYTFVQGGACPAGTLVMGGAQTNSSNGTSPILTSDHNFTGTTWYEYAKNNGASANTVTVYSTCLDLQTQTP
jgi:hypothetical protein